jgi:uncharacterized membrane protein
MGHLSSPDAMTVVLALAPDFMSATVSGMIGSLSLIVGAVGVGIVLCGAYSTVVRLIGSPVAGMRGVTTKAEQNIYGLPFTSSLLLSLDFLIGAAIIQTFVPADWQHVTSLGALVAVRALAGLSFRWEPAAKSTRKEEEAVREPTPAFEAHDAVHLLSDFPDKTPMEAAR